MDMKELSSILQQGGIVGAGGAGFPTYAKLNENADTLILNCAECEPLLRLHRQLLEKYAQEIVDTFHMIGEAVGAKELVIGIKKAYTKTIEALEDVIGAYPEVRLGLLDEVYPAGDEVVLIYEVTGKVVRPGGLPIEQGVAVFNVETVYNAYRAIQQKTPVVDKLVSVVAEVDHPVTVRVPIGTSIEETVRLAGASCSSGRALYYTKKEAKIINRSETCSGKLLSMYNVYGFVSEKPFGTSDRTTSVYAGSNMQGCAEAGYLCKHIFLLLLWSL
mgnify:CR=1 FL=1